MYNKIKLMTALFIGAVIFCPNWVFAGYQEAIDATLVKVSTYNFTHNLDSTDIDVQKALDTIDDLVLGTGTVTSVGTSNGLTGGTITGSGTISGVNAIADGSTKGVASYTAADFNSSSGNISLDYTNGQKASSSQPGFETANQTFGTVTGGASAGIGSAAQTGYTGSVVVPYAGTISSATITGTLSAGNCSAVVDVWKRAYSAGTRPTVANTITASALPTLTAATGSQDTTLTGWTTSVSANDEIAFNVNSNTCDHVNVVLKIAKS